MILKRGSDRAKERDRQELIKRGLTVGGNYFRKIHTTGIPDGKGGFRSNPSAGVSDLVGVMRLPCPHCRHPVGRFVSVEVKRAHRKLRPKQEEFRHGVLTAGGIAVVARDLEEARMEITAALVEERETGRISYHPLPTEKERRGH